VLRLYVLADTGDLREEGAMMDLSGDVSWSLFCFGAWFLHIIVVFIIL
jgi:hypothetical protein